MLFHTLTAAHRLHAMQMPTNVGFAGGWGKRRRRKTTEWQVTSRWLSKIMLMKSLLFIYSVKTVVRRELQEKHSSQWLGDCPMSWTELKSSLNGINQGGIMGNYTIEKISHDFGTLMCKNSRLQSRSFASVVREISATLTDACNIWSCFLQ